MYFATILLIMTICLSITVYDNREQNCKKCHFLAYLVCLTFIYIFLKQRILPVMKTWMLKCCVCKQICSKWQANFKLISFFLYQHFGMIVYWYVCTNPSCYKLYKSWLKNIFIAAFDSEPLKDLKYTSSKISFKTKASKNDLKIVSALSPTLARSLLLLLIGFPLWVPPSQRFSVHLSASQNSLT